MFKITHTFFIFLVVIFIIGCGKDSDPTEPDTAINSCVGCHTNYSALKQLAEPDTATGGGGCSGEAPHIEPYDRVYLGGIGYEEFKKSAHGKMKCTECHNGTDNTDDKKIAHSGNFIKHPSKFAAEKCASCHSDIVAKTKNSIHEQGWGQKRKVAMRSGLAGPHQFDQLPENLKYGYEKNCATCHATCGDCHVNRPKAAGGGLINGHSFSKKPDMVNVCIACHKTRGGHAYLGVAPGTQPDVHLTKKNFTCMNCHTEGEIHGDGNKYDHRYLVSNMPKCENCHKNIAKSNTYHAMHIEDLNCQTCHSQNYNNCGSCHIGGVGARISSYMSYKIALNPIPNVKKFKFAIVRRTLSAPDSWSNYGIPEYAKFDALPTYNYTSPHNTLRWTTRTQVPDGKSCYYNCHIIKEADTLRNKHLYLFESDLLPWEISASKNIVVDGKLPEKWKVQ